MPSKLVCFFCHNVHCDPVALHVYSACRRSAAFTETSIRVDGLPVLHHTDDAENSIFLALTDEVVTDRYAKYRELMDSQFPNTTVVVVVNWHEGLNAPDRILTIHSNADVISGSFGVTDPIWMRALLMSMESARITVGLSEWSTLVEASHWSGATNGSPPELVSTFPVPVFDVEIGSSPSSWSDPRAALAIAQALLQVPRWREPRVYSLLCVGGIHFESAFRDAVFMGPGLAVSHILPSRWVQTGGYRGQEGLKRLRSCVKTILGGVNAVVYHDSLKADQKSCLRNLAGEIDIPILNHRHVRNGQIEGWPWRSK